jgi:hypothetical protein
MKVIPTKKPLLPMKKKSSRFSTTRLALLLMMILADLLRAQVYEKVFSFTEALRSAPPGGVYGLGPHDLMEGSDGNFYGTFTIGPNPTLAPSGIFKMTPDGPHFVS